MNSDYMYWLGGEQMGNLGWYQLMTKYAKKVGGPKNFIALLMGGGYLLGKGSEVAIKKIVKATKKNSKNSREYDTQKIFEVTANGKYKDEIEMVIGDRYRVLESDGESILIEKINDSNNPYFVSADFLHKVSNFI